MSVAFLAVVMPTSVMASIAEWLGVGPSHRSPLTEYLTRSLSAMYGALEKPCGDQSDFVTIATDRARAGVPS